MNKKFYKMHGIGNDYIYFDCFDWFPSDPAAVARKLSDRHFSVGGDGVVYICPSDGADAKMRMFNADGSEGKMCGNAIRCIGKFLYEVKGIRKDVLTVETLSGVKTLVLTVREGNVLSVRVDMGAAEFRSAHIPADLAGERAVDVPLEVGGKTYRVTCVSMGNPHCVVFVPDPYAVDLGVLGPLFEHHPRFPARINTEFVRVDGRNELTMRVWERGSGETLACGTGACAAAAAMMAEGRAKRTARVYLPGGSLEVEWSSSDGHMYMTGPTVAVFDGELAD